MKNFKKKMVYTFFILWLIPHHGIGDETSKSARLLPREIIQLMRERYQEGTSYRSHFTFKKGKGRLLTGYIDKKKDNETFIRVGHANAQGNIDRVLYEVYYDEKKVQVYLPNISVVLEDNLREEDESAQGIIRQVFFLNRYNLEVEEYEDRSQIYKLNLRPKKLETMLGDLKLEVTRSGIIEKIQMKDTYGENILISFYKIQFNTKNEEEYNFEIPPGVERIRNKINQYY